MYEEREKIPREREASLCPCKSRNSYAECCMPYHYGRAQPETAEQLMRSRYSAYFFKLTDYLVATTHPDKRAPDLKERLGDVPQIVKTRWRSARGGYSMLWVMRKRQPRFRTRSERKVRSVAENL